MSEIQPIQLYGLGAQLRSMASDPSSELFYTGDIVRRAAPEASDHLPIFSEVQQKICATRGVAQVIHFPRHRLTE